MNTKLNKFGSGFLVFLMASMAGFSAHGDDTEIFFGGSGNPGIQPNVLFILDNSGSMKETDCTGKNCGNAATRMQRMKSAMNSLLDSLNNVNVGLMQFSFPGGAILYPVADIDAPLLKPQNLSLSITNGEDDAEEANGNVTLTNEILALAKRDSSGTTRLSPTVTASTDDAEEVLGTGAVTTNSASLTLTQGRAAGLIFRNQAIPQNARILSANLVFTIQQATGDAMLEEELHLDIQGQVSTSFSSLNTFSTSNNISSRNKTTAITQWSIIDPPPAAGETLASADLAAVIQEVVSDTNWSSGGDITLFLQPSANDPGVGKRVFSSFDAGSVRLPVLNITYETRQTESAQTVGLRFNDVAVPKGARITSATLEFQAAATDAGAASAYQIYGEKAANSAPFTSDSNNLTSRTDTAATVSWTPSWISDTNAAWRAGEIRSVLDDGANIAPIIEEIVNQDGWCGGNSLALFISDGGDARFASAFENAGSNSPKLKITYDPNDIPAGEGCMATTYSYRVSANNDDGRGRTSGSDNDVRNDTQLSIGTHSNNSIYTGFRFTNLQIPKNATVLNAYLEVTATGNDTSNSNLLIRVEDENNANDICSSGYNCTRLRSRDYWNTTVAWNNVPSFTNGMTYRTPDIKDLVQRIINRNGWNPGNAMLFALSGSGTRRVVSHDNNPANAARLVVRIAQTSNAVGGTTRDALKSLVSDIEPVTNTPIVDSLYEAALYFRGSALSWGDRRYHSPFNTSNGSSQWSGFNDTIAPRLRVAHPDSYTGGTVSYPSGCSADNPSSKNCKEEAIIGSPTYISPIVDQCQTNHIVVLTDGAPTGSGSASLVKSLIDNSTCDDSGHEACGPELAKFLYDNDHSSLPGTQNIFVHTIAFNLNDQTATNWLDQIAKEGNGDPDGIKGSGVKSASSASELEDVFRNLTGDIIGSVNTTFVSPGVTVNTFNRLTHRNELYFALFRPETRPSWPGNLKRYRINTDGDILDRNGVSVIDPNTGFFIETARSFWSDANDGNDVTKGGAASQLPTSTTRKVYTHYSGSSNTLSNAANALTTSNNNITKARLGLENSVADSYRNNLINWARGLDPVSGNERKRLADPLHSIPHLVTYGGTDEAPDITIYHGDNEGFLHATRASDGVELFSFIPEELLPRLKLLYENSGATKHPYGMDGPINSWVRDVNGDSQIDADEGDHVYLYAGMRRGGRSLYALNVTNRNAPVLMWTITGGNGDYAELGQTWSRPVKTRVNLNGTVKDVLVMGGGYDPTQDDSTVISSDNMGRAIFIIDAATGDKLWSVGPSGSHNLIKSDMTHSIPANVRILDTNGDGLMDQMYVGDVGGQLWRFDVHQGKTANNLVTGAVIADISGTTPASARRFYHEPEVSLIVENNRRKLAIVIGSGFQAHPLDQTVTDRIYMIKQAHVTSAPPDGDDAGTDPDYVKLTEADLFDATDNSIQDGTTEQQAAALAALAAADGWYVTLADDGEKVLSTPLVVAGRLLVSTYSPTMDYSGCNPTAGTSRLYDLRLDDGVGEFETLKTVGIPPSPVRLRIIADPPPPTDDPEDPENPEDPEDNTPTQPGGTSDVICVGTYCKPLGDSVSVIKTYWHNE